MQLTHNHKYSHERSIFPYTSAPSSGTKGSFINYFLLKGNDLPTPTAQNDPHAAIETLLYPIESCDPFMAVDFHKSIHHPLVLLLRCIGAVLQNQASFGDPDRIGQAKRHRP